MKLGLTPKAEQDLSAIFDYSAELWGEDRAVAYLRMLQTSLDRLLRFPELGRAAEEVGTGVRILSAGTHIIVYRLLPDMVAAIRILHQRMDITRHL